MNANKMEGSYVKLEQVKMEILNIKISFDKSCSKDEMHAIKETENSIKEKLLERVNGIPRIEVTASCWNVIGHKQINTEKGRWCMADILACENCGGQVLRPDGTPFPLRCPKCDAAMLNGRPSSTVYKMEEKR